jgi:ABC-2 type transport system permease protein
MRAVRSELVRLRRPGYLLGWFGLTAVFAALINAVMFQVSGEASGPAEGPGVTFPTVEALLGADGIVAGLGAASSMFGVVTLSFWAIAAASDHSTGLIRILVAAEPRRWRLLLGKWVALAAVTAAATVVALVVNVVVAPVAASSAGLEPTAWGTDIAAIALGAALDLYLALLVWGTIGLALAELSRSAGVAIGVGVGWVLLVEGVVAAAVDEVSDWLPGATIGALATGGSSAITYGTALALGAAYAGVALLVTLVTITKRDITD